MLCRYIKGTTPGSEGSDYQYFYDGCRSVNKKWIAERERALKIRRHPWLNLGKDKADHSSHRQITASAKCVPGCKFLNVYSKGVLNMWHDFGII